MGEMVGMIAHQWRQPLNAISAAVIKVNVLNEIGTLTSEELNATFKFIQDMTQKMSVTISDFMEDGTVNTPCIVTDLYGDCISIFVGSYGDGFIGYLFIVKGISGIG